MGFSRYKRYNLRTFKSLDRVFALEKPFFYFWRQIWNLTEIFRNFEKSPDMELKSKKMSHGGPFEYNLLFEDSKIFRFFFIRFTFKIQQFLQLPIRKTGFTAFLREKSIRKWSKETFLTKNRQKRKQWLPLRLVKKKQNFKLKKFLDGSSSSIGVRSLSTNISWRCLYQTLQRKSSKNCRKFRGSHAERVL